MCLLSENNSFTYTDMMSMPTHILLGLYNEKNKIQEKRDAEERKQQGSTSVPNINSLMSQVKSGMPSLPKIPH